jgi:hypothetical protein
MAESVREAPAESPPAATRARQRAERARGAMPRLSSFSSSFLSLFASGSFVLVAAAPEGEEPKSVCDFPAPVWPVFCRERKRARTRRDGGS